jgi:hypothetical protein
MRHGDRDTVFQTLADGWQTNHHVYIWDLSNPANPVFIRQWGLPGQQPTANPSTAQSCYNAPGPNCYEGVTNPPTGTHDVYSAGVTKNRVYFGMAVAATVSTKSSTGISC